MPTALSLSILVNDVEMISFIPFSSMSFVDYPARVSSFNFIIENPTTAPALHDDVIITSGATTIFIGNIVELNSNKRDNGIITVYEVECADYKIKLLKSYLIRGEYTGSDATILTNLLSNTYPDLTSYFDFATNVTSFLSDMALDTNENSLLDALHELSELAGGAAIRFDQALFDIVTVDFEGASYTLDFLGTFLTVAQAAVGNPGDAAQGTYVGVTANFEGIEVTINLPISQNVNNITFEYYLDTTNAGLRWSVFARNGGSPVTSWGEDIASATGQWVTIDLIGDGFDLGSFPVTADEIIVTLEHSGTAGASHAHDYRLDNIVIEDVAANITVDFDSGYSSYTLFFCDAFIVAVAAVGNPGNAAQGLFTGVISTYDCLSVVIDLPSSQNVANISFDYYFATNPDGIAWRVFARNGGSPVDNWFEEGLSPLATWVSANVIDDAFDPSGLPVTADQIIIELERADFPGASMTHDFRLDNIKITGGDGKDSLVWDSEPDASDFNIDVQSGNEFAFDLDLFEGSIEDYNSITVIGGSIDVAVDYTMESDGDLIYFPIATHIRDIVVYKNTGTDGSPTWTVQSDGQWGVDELTSAGGSKDVLYDAIEHWLVFNSTPSNLSKSIRLTGTISKPIRVRVEDVGAGEPTYATTVYAENVQTEDEAVAYAQSLLATNDAIKRMTFKTYEPGLKPGQNIDIDDSARGLNETLRITKISTRWLGASGHAEFTVECGNDEAEDAGVLIANNDMRSRENRDANVAVTSTITTLFDADGTTILTDTDGRRLYESA